MSAERRTDPHRGRDLVLGGFLGGLAGAVVALNVLIFAGIEGGYEASLADAFDQRPFVAFAIVLVLVCSPVLGALLAHRYRLFGRR